MVKRAKENRTKQPVFVNGKREYVSIQTKWISAVLADPDYSDAERGEYFTCMFAALLDGNAQALPRRRVIGKVFRGQQKTFLDNYKNSVTGAKNAGKYEEYAQNEKFLQKTNEDLDS